MQVKLLETLCYVSAAFEFSPMIDRAAHSPIGRLLRRGRTWYGRLPASAAFSFQACFLLVWTMIITAVTYGLVDLMPS